MAATQPEKPGTRSMDPVRGRVHALSDLLGFDRLRGAHGLVAASLLTALALLLPLAPDLVPPLMVAALLALVAKHRPWRRSAMEFHAGDGPLLGLVAFYVLHVVGMAWSRNSAFGLFDLQVKLPLLLFPLILLRMPHAARQGGDCLVRAFVAGNALAVLCCCAWVPVHALAPGGQWSTAVFGSDFSLFMHPSYFAMYLGFSMGALLDPDGTGRISPPVRLAMVLLLGLGIVLCGSKAGWAGLFLVPLVALAFHWRHARLRRMVLGLFAGSLLAVGLLIAASPNVRERVSEAWRAAVVHTGHADAATSSEERKLTWSGAVDVIQRNLPFGTGTGDVKDELIAAYARKGYHRLVELRLNAHQQFLQTMAALGWPGVLILTAVLTASLYQAVRAKNVLAITFLLLNLFNWTVESMLEVQAGVVFFAYLTFALSCRLPGAAPIPKAGSMIH